ncbi:lysophospholipid acyltransferase family protein [Blastopirellula marina]|uniref:Phospholipid/glycerol acyltransferase domain-containing protein n=1 Tax=Blastopirellula marina TaxID=124 RepID=A0A2S8FNX6_9BACT|nr:lysophospholipid acyltransferase family protein [Blastopirellula marina]PQO33902.1 hypothetical protein C5Y98_16910 [Blastopirellula marina]PTL43689.1 1-acyl-sn-glycerol-3-phosphate acyltransferase [Blastopirellula marina]
MNVPFVLGWIAVVIVGLAILVGIQIRRTEYTLVQFFLDRIVFILLQFLWRTKTPAELPLARDKGGVIIANHRSSADPFFIHRAARRRVRWMVAREYCERKVMGWFLNEFGAIPTRRGGIDNASVREAVNLLQQGNWVGVLPEGRINMTDQFMLPVRPGAALLARRAGVPIVPVYIEGAPFNETPISPFLMSAQVTIYVGEPIYPDAFDSDELMILAAVKEIARLAGHSDFQPQLAGKNWKPTEEEVALAIAKAKEGSRS